jgi:hypothetical protein
MRARFLAVLYSESSERGECRSTRPSAAEPPHAEGGLAIGVQRLIDEFEHSDDGR